MKRTFHYLPPAPEEQRAFFVQFVGTVAGLIVAAILWFVVHEARMRAVLIGAVLATVWLLAQSAWKLEKKAQRSENSEVSLDDDSLHITNERGQTLVLPFTQIENCQVLGGRLLVTSGGKRVLEVGARELEDGMTLVQNLLALWSGKSASQNGFAPPSNFIPLDPK
jgi:hypothetical protein